jgi:hypothetical protein
VSSKTARIAYLLREAAELRGSARNCRHHAKLNDPELPARYLHGVARDSVSLARQALNDVRALMNKQPIAFVAPAFGV